MNETKKINSEYKKPILYDFEIDELPSPKGMAKFRQKQLTEWLYDKGVQSFDEMSNLPKEWRKDLAENYLISPFKQIKVFPSSDNSIRYLFTLRDGMQTEAVYMPYKTRKTICISSMVGCPAGCAFCATGAMGFGRNLSKAEIIAQIMAVAYKEKIAPKEIRNVVLMGMGEALLNYDNAISAIKTMIDKRALDMSARRITVSTVGLPKQIIRLAKEGLPLVLAVSLHAADDSTRKEIIPTANAHPVFEIIQSLYEWQRLINRRITIEYVMLAGVNDSEWQAEVLAKQIKKLKKVHVNLIPFNSWGESKFKTSNNKIIRSFRKVLEHNGVEVSVRFSRGQDAGAACGQLALTKK